MMAASHAGGKRRDGWRALGCRNSAIGSTWGRGSEGPVAHGTIAIIPGEASSTNTASQSAAYYAS